MSFRQLIHCLGDLAGMLAGQAQIGLVAGDARVRRRIRCWR